MGKNEELVALVQQGEDVKKNIELLYNNNIGLLFRIASRYRGLAEMEDLTQETFIALYNAIYSFNPDKGTQFSTYLTKCTTCHLSRYVSGQQLINIPEGLKKQIIKYNFLCCQYEMKYARKPSAAEIGWYLGLNGQQVDKLLKVAEMVNISSLNKPTGEEEGSGTIADLLPDPESEKEIETILDEQIYNELWKEVDRLEPVQGKVIKCLYLEGLTSKAAGERLGLEPQEVIKQHRNAIKRLRQTKGRYDYMGSRLYCRGTEWLSTPERIAIYG